MQHSTYPILHYSMSSEHTNFHPSILLLPFIAFWGKIIKATIQVLPFVYFFGGGLYNNRLFLLSDATKWRIAMLTLVGGGAFGPLAFPSVL